MSNIDELQRRITAAMDRIAYGLEKIGAPATPDPQSVQALKDERTANAQLSERVQTLRDKLDRQTGDSRRQLDENESRTAQLDVELQRVRRANKELQDACAALREANTAGVGEPHLINKAMMAELEGLRATRAADIAEVDAILSTLTPLVESAEQHEEDA